MGPCWAPSHCFARPVLLRVRQCLCLTLVFLPDGVPSGLVVTPSPTRISDVPLMTTLPSTTPPTASLSSPVPVSSLPALPLASPTTQPLLLSPSFTPLPVRLVERIQRGEFVEMRELLTDNIALLRQLEEVQPNTAVFHQSPGTHPRLRDISSILTWVYCFLAYCMVRTDDQFVRGLLTYDRLGLREARRYGGSGWIEYDHIFRQQAATDPCIQWNALSPSLVALTFLGSRTDQGAFCTLCQEVDHSPQDCALRVLWEPPISCPQGTTESQPCPLVSHRMRPETLERICVSWNKGRCAYPGSCTLKHKCATCRIFGHKASDCADTPDTSEYKASTHPNYSRQPPQDQRRQDRTSLVYEQCCVVLLLITLFCL